MYQSLTLTKLGSASTCLQSRATNPGRNPPLPLTRAPPDGFILLTHLALLRKKSPGNLWSFIDLTIVLWIDMFLENRVAPTWSFWRLSDSTASNEEFHKFWKELWLTRIQKGHINVMLLNQKCESEVENWKKLRVTAKNLSSVRCSDLPMHVSREIEEMVKSDQLQKWSTWNLQQLSSWQVSSISTPSWDIVVSKFIQQKNLVRFRFFSFSRKFQKLPEKQGHDFQTRHWKTSDNIYITDNSLSAVTSWEKAMRRTQSSVKHDFSIFEWIFYLEKY